MLSTKKTIIICLAVVFAMAQFLALPNLSKAQISTSSQTASQNFLDLLPVTINESELFHTKQISVTQVQGDKLSVQIGFEPGWNIFSIPVVLDNPEISSALSSLAGSYDYVCAYDEYRAKSYQPSRPINDLDSIDPNHGYLIHITQTDTLVVEGTRPDYVIVALNKGANLIPYPLENPLPVAQALDSLSNTRLDIYTYVSTYEASGAKTYVPGRPINDLTEFKQGQGYWLETSEDAVLLYGQLTNLETVKIELFKGDNTISIPLTVQDNRIENVLSSISGKYTYLYTNDGFRTKSYQPGRPINDLQRMNYKHGYDVKVSEPATLTIQGVRPQNTVITLGSGWNCIPYIYNQSVSTPDALISIKGKYNQIRRSYADGSKTYEPGRTINDLLELNPSEGYWLDTKQETSLEYAKLTAGVPATPPVSGPTLPPEPIDDEICLDVYQPVCGIDNITYSNQCYADKAGVEVECSSACPCPAPETIETDETEICINVYQPVCGIDNITYSNECYANQAGISIECYGTCPCQNIQPQDTAPTTDEAGNIIPSPTALSASNMAKRLKGRLLLQVQQGGAIWYVDHINYQKHNVTWTNALPLFERFALGISDADLLKIPASTESIRPDLDTDKDGYSDRSELGNGYSPYIPGAYQGKLRLDTNLANRLKGRLLLQVQQGGAIWYVDQDGIRHNVRWSNLMDLFRALALGITDSDLGEIVTGN